MSRLVVDHRAPVAVSRTTESTFIRLGTLEVELSDEQARAVLRGLTRALPREWDQERAS